ncbi:MAG: DUF72 domain-containing protein [Actinomycetota bacterium]
MAGTLFVGTSGFAYREWKPEFYPAALKNAEMLSFYSSHFSSVEINNTFYRAPTEKMLKSWVEQTPESFRFTLKAPQRITHFAGLRDAEESVEYFLRTARALGDRLGCILFQCPPSLRYERRLLADFLALLPGEPFRFAMEFRHPSWDDAEVREALAANNTALCVADTGTATPSVVRTAQGFMYMRLRGLDYSDEDLRAWSTPVRAALEEGADVYVYFKHEDDPSGVRFALRFRDLVAG